VQYNLNCVKVQLNPNQQTPVIFSASKLASTDTRIRLADSEPTQLHSQCPHIATKLTDPGQAKGVGEAGIQPRGLYTNVGIFCMMPYSLKCSNLYFDTDAIIRLVEILRVSHKYTFSIIMRTGMIG